MIEVVPAVHTESFDELYVDMSQVKSHVDRVQFDISDGSYAKSVTWPFSSNEHFAEITREEEGLPFWRDLDVELDMLIAQPERLLEEWIRTGIVAVIIHIESTEVYEEIFKKLKDYGVEIGWGIKPNTPNNKLFTIIDDVGVPDFVQVMGNDKVGYHGVELDERVYDKIKAIRERYSELPIAIDIGVNEDTAPKLVESGVTKLVSTSAIFGTEDTEEAIEYFQNLT